jgi:hypothetical protein
MNRLTSAMSWLILGTGLFFASAYSSEATQNELQGTWTAAEQDGIADNAVIQGRPDREGFRAGQD